VPIRVFVVRQAIFGNVDVTSGASPIDLPSTSPALAIIATEGITVSGTVHVSQGNLSSGTCTGVDGQSSYDEEPGQVMTAGGGGGGAATAGGNGGMMGPMGSPPGGTPSGMDSLEPLRGGCAGGGTYSVEDPTYGYPGGPGGGAIQLSSRTQIEIDGTINVNGVDGGGGGDQSTNFVLGGGGGGGVLLEAPTVAIGSVGALSAAGGNGFGCMPSGAYCGGGGNGATGSVAAGAGGDSDFDHSHPTMTSGAGGGGLGRIRINTPTASYASTATSVLNGHLTTGTLRTR
jgi:hypothetical protein